MGKNGYLQRQRNTVNVYRQAEKETYIQFMTDTLILTLNDPSVMGKDVFGEKRIRRVVEAWGKVFDKYHDLWKCCTHEIKDGKIHFYMACFDY